MVILGDKLFISLGDTYNTPAVAQNMNSINGKVLRMNLDGSVPSDNPIAGSYIWSWGHRNPQGMCYGNGKLYSSEHGTSGNDEVNIILSNRNYGWPTVEGVCNTTAEITFCNANNVAEPIHSWTPSIAPAGMELYQNAAIPEWNNSLLVAVLKNKQLVQLKLNADGSQVVQQNIYLTNTYGRLRDVLPLPDGRIFVCTSNRDYAGTPIAADDRIIELRNQALGLNHYAATQTVLHPLPCSDELFIESPYDIASVLISGIDGKTVYNQLFSNPVDLSGIKAGIYCLQLLDADNTVIEQKKIVIQ